MTAEATVGVVGLGNMGQVLAANLAGAGLDVVAHDAAGPERAPAGVTFVNSADEVVRRATTVVLSLPDGAASAAVVDELLAADGRRTDLVIDTSTVGVRAAEALHARLQDEGVDLVDAPVSGGIAGAKSRTLLVMVAGTAAAVARAEPVLAGLSDRCHRVGDRPGLAQAMKLANNYCSAAALAATSEAVAFGLAAGLDLATMLDVLNAASGQSAATTDKFPNHVLTGRYAAGFAGRLMAKDVGLYLDEVEAAGSPHALADTTVALWRAFAAAEPDADFTRIFPFIESSG